MLQNILLKEIQNQYDITEDNVHSVGYGRKYKNGVDTGELAIVYSVDKKIPKDQLPPDQILPDSLIIDGKKYYTDIVEAKRIKPLASCWGYGFNNGSVDATNVLPHRQIHRPLQGGIFITNIVGTFNSSNNTIGVGTFGLICVDKDTNTLVGLTNIHVPTPDQFNAVERTSTNSTHIRNVLQTGTFTSNSDGSQVQIPDCIQQFSESDFNLTNIINLLPGYEIGKIKKYQPMRSIGNGINYIDALVFTLIASKVSNSVSFKQLGQSFSSALPWATTAELNNLLVSNPYLYSSGRTTGRKGDTCKLRIISINNTTSLTYIRQGISTEVTVSDTFEFAWENSSLRSPVYGGDSGSAIIAVINGTPKIIGLVFAGDAEDNQEATKGVGCRIDHIASILNLEPWDGSSKNVDSSANLDIQYINGLDSAVTKTINNKKYWQVGISA
jgi:hypothetical protein